MSKTSTGANNRPAQGILKASLGTTKYCNHWLKNLQCPKLPDCMYLHEVTCSVLRPVSALLFAPPN